MQPNDYVSLRREFVEELQNIDGETLKVFIALLARNQHQKSIKTGLTLPELARTANVGTATAQRALLLLHEGKYIDLTSSEKHDIIRVSEEWIGESPTLIPYTTKNTDETKVAKVEKELRRVELGIRRQTESELRGITQGEERELIVELERFFGRALEEGEIYLIGKAVSRFGPDRFQSTWRRMKSNKNSIRATYAALSRGIKGRPAQVVESKPFQVVKYRELD